MTPSCDSAIADMAWNFVFDDKSVSPYCADESAFVFILILNALPAAPAPFMGPPDAQVHGVADCVPLLVDNDDGVIIIIGVAGIPLFPLVLLLPLPPPLRVRFTVFAVEFVLHSHV